MGDFVSTEQDGAVAVVTIDHPPVNALSAPLLEELEAEIDRLDADDAVRAIVLRGAGERAFVAGADISEFPSLREAAAEAHESGSARGIQKLGARMDKARTPFVAAIHGFCLGGGLELAMCCDIRVASEDAQLGQPEIKLGLIPGGGGTQRLPRLVGLGRALLLNMTGDFVDAQTAYGWGLVEKVVPREELHEAALGIARTIAARSPVSIGDPARARADDARPPARGGAAARGGRLPPLPRVARTAPRAWPRSSRSASRSSPAGDASPTARLPADTCNCRLAARSTHRRLSRSCETVHRQRRSVRAVVLTGTGGPEQLVVQDVPEPDAGDGAASSTCGRPGSTSPTSSCGSGSTRRCPSCRRSSAPRSRASSTGTA